MLVFDLPGDRWSAGTLWDEHNHIEIAFERHKLVLLVLGTVITWLPGKVVKQQLKFALDFLLPRCRYIVKVVSPFLLYFFSPQWGRKL